MDEIELEERQDNYVSEFAIDQRVQTPSELGEGWLVSVGTVTGFDAQGYPIVAWEDGEFPGESWEDEDLEAYVPPAKGKRR